MKPLLIAATVATLTFAPASPVLTDELNDADKAHETRQRETRKEREGRLREAQRRSDTRQRETRCEREARLRKAAHRGTGYEVWESDA